MKTALAIGAGAVALYVLYRFASARTTPVMVTPAAPPPARTLEELGERIAVRGLNRVGQAFTELATGTSGSQFKRSDELSDGELLKFRMCTCFRTPAGQDSIDCAGVRQMAPGVQCKGGDCDCNPLLPSPGVIEYHTHDTVTRGLPRIRAEYGPRALATAWVDGVVPGSAPAPRKTAADVPANAVPLLKTLGFISG